MAKTKTTRKEREYLRHRPEIPEAALDLFLKKGRRKASMKDIAEAFEFAIGTLYNFFKIKTIDIKPVLWALRL